MTRRTDDRSRDRLARLVAVVEAETLEADTVDRSTPGGSSIASHQLPDSRPAVARIAAAARRDVRGTRSGRRVRLAVTPVAAVGAMLMVGVVAALALWHSFIPEATAVPSPTIEQESVAVLEPDGSASAPGGQQILVHVAGHVAAPGVVALSEGSRVEDAIAAAGGALPDAELTLVNLARVAVDGEQVYVPDASRQRPTLAEAAGATSVDGGSTPALIDVNTADATALDTLPGIGPVIATRIVDHRLANGPFASVDELTDVSGIGPALVEKIRDRVRVG